MSTPPPGRKRSNVASEHTRSPFQPGDTVLIYNIKLTADPFVEGEAEIIYAIENCPGFYVVRFSGEQQPRIRLVLNGDWQRQPALMLEQLHNVLLAALMPDHADDYPPSPVASGGHE